MSRINLLNTTAFSISTITGVIRCVCVRVSVDGCVGVDNVAFHGVFRVNFDVYLWNDTFIQNQKKIYINT